MELFRKYDKRDVPFGEGLQNSKTMEHIEALLKAESAPMDALSTSIPAFRVDKQFDEYQQELEAKCKWLRCQICFKVKRLEILVPCGHSYCSVCIQEHYKKTRLGETKRCPHCATYIDQKCPNRVVTDFLDNQTPEIQSIQDVQQHLASGKDQLEALVRAWPAESQNHDVFLMVAREWLRKAKKMFDQGRFSDVLWCLDRSMELDPPGLEEDKRFIDTIVRAWKARMLVKAKRFRTDLPEEEKEEGAEPPAKKPALEPELTLQVVIDTAKRSLKRLREDEPMKAFMILYNAILPLSRLHGFTQEEAKWHQTLFDGFSTCPTCLLPARLVESLGAIVAPFTFTDYTEDLCVRARLERFTPHLIKLWHAPCTDRCFFMLEQAESFTLTRQARLVAMASFVLYAKGPFTVLGDIDVERRVTDPGIITAAIDGLMHQASEPTLFDKAIVDITLIRRGVEETDAFGVYREIVKPQHLVDLHAAPEMLRDVAKEYFQWALAPERFQGPGADDDAVLHRQFPLPSQTQSSSSSSS